MVLLVLALIWGALLVSWLRSRSASTFSDSVGSFRRNLNVLERATPSRVVPANRLGTTYAGVRPGGIRGERIEAAASPGRLVPVVASPARVSVTTGRLPASRTAAALRRRQAQKRRRDVLIALIAGTAGSFLLALVPGLSILWSVQVLFDLLLAAYVAILVRMRNLAAERELKLRFIPAARTPVRARPSYEMGATGYGDLDFRRAAN